MFHSAAQRWILGLVFCLTLVLNACRSTESLVARGDELFKEGKYVEAELEYQRALQKDPQAGSIQAKIAKGLQMQGKPREALAALMRANELSPSDRTIRVDLADQLLRMFLASTRRSKPLYEKLNALSKEFLAESINSVPGLQIRGALALVDGRYPDAIRDLEAVRQQDPSLMLTSLSLVEAYYFGGRTGEAEQLAQKLIASHPSSRDPYLRLYSLYVSASKPDLAVGVLERFLAANPKDSAMTMQLFRHHFTAGDKARAKEVADRLVKDTKNFPDGSQLVATYFLERAQPQESIRVAESALVAAPTDPIALRKILAEAYRQIGNLKAAKDQIEEAANQAPKDSSITLAKAIILMETPGAGNLKQALTLLQGLKKTAPDEPNLDYHLGRVLTLDGKPEDGVRAFQEAVQKRRSNTDARFALASYAIDRRRFAEALQQLDQIDLYLPESEHSRTLRLRTLLDMGRPEEARVLLQQALKEFPDSESIKLVQARILATSGKFQELQELLEPLLEKGFRSFDLIALLGEAYAANNQLPRAIRLIQKERERLPDNSGLILLEADLHTRNRDLPQAMAILGPASAKPNAPPAVLLRSAFLHGRMGKPAEAAKLLERLVAATSLTDQHLALWLEASLEAKDRAQVERICQRMEDEKLNTWTALNNCAFATIQVGGDISKAERFARKALADKPASVNVKDTLAWVLTKKGDYDQALRLYSEIEKQSANDAQIRFHHGIALRGAGQNSRAVIQLESALKLNPNVTLRDDIMTNLRTLKNN